MRMWQVVLGAAAMASATGCSSLIGNHIPIEMQVVAPGANFIDKALAHRYSDWYSIVGSNTPDFGTRIPLSRIAEQVNRRVADDGPDRTMAYLIAQGCEPTGERSCAYYKVLRRLEERHETERRLVTLHFSLAPGAIKGCATCVEVRLEVAGRT